MTQCRFFESRKNENGLTTCKLNTEVIYCGGHAYACKDYRGKPEQLNLFEL